MRFNIKAGLEDIKNPSRGMADDERRRRRLLRLGLIKEEEDERAEEEGVSLKDPTFRERQYIKMFQDSRPDHINKFMVERGIDPNFDDGLEFQDITDLSSDFLKAGAGAAGSFAGIPLGLPGVVGGGAAAGAGTQAVLEGLSPLLDPRGQGVPMDSKRLTSPLYEGALEGAGAFALGAGKIAGWPVKKIASMPFVRKGLAKMAGASTDALDYARKHRDGLMEWFDKLKKTEKGVPASPDRAIDDYAMELGDTLKGQADVAEGALDRQLLEVDVPRGSGPFEAPYKYPAGPGDDPSIMGDIIRAEDKLVPRAPMPPPPAPPDVSDAAIKAHLNAKKVPKKVKPRRKKTPVSSEVKQEVEVLQEAGIIDEAAKLAKKEIPIKNIADVKREAQTVNEAGKNSRKSYEGVFKRDGKEEGAESSCRQGGAV